MCILVYISFPRPLTQYIIIYFKINCTDKVLEIVPMTGLKATYLNYHIPTSTSLAFLHAVSLIKCKLAGNFYCNTKREELQARLLHWQGSWNPISHHLRIVQKWGRRVTNPICICLLSWGDIWNIISLFQQYYQSILIILQLNWLRKLVGVTALVFTQNAYTVGTH